jgi:methyl-accepting chemotaxis protein
MGRSAVSFRAIPDTSPSGAVHAINSETKELDVVIDMASLIDNAFEQIQSAMLALAGSNMQIATATEEQHAVANNLDHAVIHLAGEAAANAAAVAQISLGSSNLATLAVDLESTTAQFKTS